MSCEKPNSEKDIIRKEAILSKSFLQFSIEEEILDEQKRRPEEAQQYALSVFQAESQPTTAITESEATYLHQFADTSSSAEDWDNIHLAGHLDATCATQPITGIGAEYLSITNAIPCATQDWSDEAMNAQDWVMSAINAIPCATQDWIITPCATQDIMNAIPCATQDWIITPCATQDITNAIPCATQDWSNADYLLSNETDYLMTTMPFAT